MRVLFIGGTGVISSACSQLVVEQGHELFLLNRGKTSRPVPKEARIITADIRDVGGAKAALSGLEFDVVVNWIAFTPEQVRADVELFSGRTGQYVFISSASAYKKPVTILPITESTPLINPFWQYSHDKAACEALLMEKCAGNQFPVTIVRPSHTYDKTLFPFRGGYAVLERMRKGLPVIVHGDGTSLWTMTHHTDFARGFVGLLGNPHALGEAFHITSDEVLTWNQIFALTANAAGAEPKLVHIPSEFIARYDEEWGASLLGDKSHSVIFDNAKIKTVVPSFKATVPFWQGIREVVAFYDANPEWQQMDQDFMKRYQQILTAYGERA